MRQVHVYSSHNAMVPQWLEKSRIFNDPFHNETRPDQCFYVCCVAGRSRPFSGIAHQMMRVTKVKSGIGITRDDRSFAHPVIPGIIGLSPLHP